MELLKWTDDDEAEAWWHFVRAFHGSERPPLAVMERVLEQGRQAIRERKTEKVGNYIVNSLAGEKVGHVKENKFIAESGWPQVHGQISTVSFQIQSGPIKEFGENGCQIDDVIEWAKEKIEGFNKAFPCRENSVIITKLDEALLWSLKRKMDREKRSVEGTNKA